MQKKISVMIVDDSLVYRSQIKSALASIPWVDIVATASNGRIALERLSQHSIDLVILDLEMPEMDGLQTLKEIKKRGILCQVIMFSSTSQQAVATTLEALKHGALDFITKPSDTSDNRSPDLKIRTLLEPKIQGLFYKEIRDLGEKISTSSVLPFLANKLDLPTPQVVVIGSSTGGPRVLELIMSKIKTPIEFPILIAQHMPPIFTTSFAARISEITGINAFEATDGLRVNKNTIYVAPGDYHMTLVADNLGAKIHLNKDEPINSVRPSVDPLFYSAAQIYKKNCLGIVLTGMGCDGKNGALQIKSKGGTVVIQNEESCVVFGMPGAVLAAGACDASLDPSEIVQLLNQLNLESNANFKNAK